MGAVTPAAAAGTICCLNPSGAGAMLTTVEAILDAGGTLRFVEPVRLARAQRVLVTFTEPLDESVDGAVMSERSLAADWLRNEEDAAWTHLRPTEPDAGGKTDA